MPFQLLFLVLESDNVSYVHLLVFISLTCNQSVICQDPLWCWRKLFYDKTCKYICMYKYILDPQFMEALAVLRFKGQLTGYVELECSEHGQI